MQRWIDIEPMLLLKPEQSCSSQQRFWIQEYMYLICLTWLTRTLGTQYRIETTLALIYIPVIQSFSYKKYHTTPHTTNPAGEGGWLWLAYGLPQALNSMQSDLCLVHMRTYTCSISLIE